MPDTTDPPITETSDPSEPPAKKPRRPRRKKTPPPEPAKTLTDLIIESAGEPKSAAVDGQTVQGRDLRELIEAERYLASKKAIRRPAGGLRITPMSHSGTT